MSSTFFQGGIFLRLLAKGQTDRNFRNLPLQAEWRGHEWTASCM